MNLTTMFSLGIFYLENIHFKRKIIDFWGTKQIQSNINVV